MSYDLFFDATSGKFVKFDKEYVDYVDRVCMDAKTKFDTILKDRRYLTIAEVCDYLYPQLGLQAPSTHQIGLDENGDPVDPYEFGWTYVNQELHRLSFKEKHPNGCPYCGRPW